MIKDVTPLLDQDVIDLDIVRAKIHSKIDLSVVGPTRPLVRSCWIEEIRKPAKEELQKSQRIDCISAGVAQIARIAMS